MVPQALPDRKAHKDHRAILEPLEILVPQVCKEQLVLPDHKDHKDHRA